MKRQSSFYQCQKCYLPCGTYILFRACEVRFCNEPHGETFIWMQVFYARGVTKRRVRVEQTKNAIKSYGRSVTSGLRAWMLSQLIAENIPRIARQIIGESMQNTKTRWNIAMLLIFEILSDLQVICLISLLTILLKLQCALVWQHTNNLSTFA